MTWWWNNEISAVIEEKRRCWKLWKQGGSKEEYLEAKRATKRLVHAAKKIAEENEFAEIKPGMNGIFKMLSR